MHPRNQRQALISIVSVPLLGGARVGFRVPIHDLESSRLSMNLLFGVPALAGPGRLKAGHRTDGTTQTGSWSRCTASKSWGLSMNLKTLALILKGLRVSGSWSQCMRKKTERGLSMNRDRA